MCKPWDVFPRLYKMPQASVRQDPHAGATAGPVAGSETDSFENFARPPDVRDWLSAVGRPRKRGRESLEIPLPRLHLTNGQMHVTALLMVLHQQQRWIGQVNWPSPDPLIIADHRQNGTECIYKGRCATLRRWTRKTSRLSIPRHRTAKPPHIVLHALLVHCPSKQHTTHRLTRLTCTLPSNKLQSSYTLTCTPPQELRINRLTRLSCSEPPSLFHLRHRITVSREAGVTESDTTRLSLPRHHPSQWLLPTRP